MIQRARRASRPPASSGWSGTAPTPAAAARAAAPRLEHLAGRSTAALLPAITVCTGSLKLAASAPVRLSGAKPLRRLAHQAITLAASRPSTAAMAPVPTGTASCMACARRRTSGAAWASVSTPAGHQRGIFTQRMARPPRRAPRRSGHPDAVGRHAGHQHHRLGVGGQRQRLLGTACGSARRHPSQRIGRFAQRLRTTGWSPQASSMPTDCEPWPGNTKANGFMDHPQHDPEARCQQEKKSPLG
jgi:hypothetical protein